MAGEVTLSGAKNLASKLMLATLLTEEECILENVPEIGESDIALAMVARAGGHVERTGTTVRIRNHSISESDLSTVPRNRLSILAIGPLLFRTGRAIVPVPGGDQIGKRPVDFHLTALRQFGATITEEGGLYVAEALELTGTAVTLPYPSVGATETVLLCGAWANGTTTLTNAAIEPEVSELVHFLRELGVTIDSPSERTFVIQGTHSFKGATQRVIPDRLEAISYAAAALATRGDVRMHGAMPEHLNTYQTFVNDIGGSFEILGDALRVSAHGPLRPTVVRTDVYPGFATDWQQPSAVALLTAAGESVIHETVMDNRFGYCDDLIRMGAQISVSTNCVGTPCRFNGQSAHVARISGPTQLTASQITIPDIRAGMAHLIAALIAHGESTLIGLEHLDRGYGQQLEEKLRALGATIRRVELP
ncbi:UDP-N-acetylglucosamine 1-carboxyvinyltransferase [Candidatus Berkelbacteria bacterium]|nr:UDP-N-acetylglucosamine 1-carboxyvinyltransferase [Candidatus Berkelbacteria bacterium]